jgi:hypothetical protein
MADKNDLKRWVLEAIPSNGTGITVTDAAKHIWQNHEPELRASGDLFYTWQYDMRWAAQTLRRENKLAPAPRGSRAWRRPT